MEWNMSNEGITSIDFTDYIPFLVQSWQNIDITREVILKMYDHLIKLSVQSWPTYSKEMILECVIIPQP